jgi:DNA-binding MarR family transcriptional regulator
MPVQPTSRWAYETVEVTARQAEVLGAIRRLGGEATDQQIAEHLGWTINRVTPRRGELVEQELVARARLEVGPVGRLVSVWRLVLRQGDLFGPEVRDQRSEDRKGERA